MKEYLHTKNTYYSAIASAISGAAGGDARVAAIISAAITAVDVAAYPNERPAHITSGKWLVGNLLSSTAVGLIAYGVGLGARKLMSDKKHESFVGREDIRQAEVINALQQRTL